ncbi:hypothetical protein SBRCBS47491_001086 [Sporothrix bragantina]|uniref:Beta-mannosidase B n=1 Tax=Sporothrix bragantina TaxID=671064 RepID=A0ABP0AW16_9PEZI
MSKITIQLADGWQWHMGSANGSKEAAQLATEHQLCTPSPVASFPSVVQAELLARKIIPDPYIGENERLVQWVSDVDWVYTTAFSTPADAASRARVDLVLEGLDTFATVKLNGSVILESDNMFVPARINVKTLLKDSGENTLEIVFRSAIALGNELEAKYGARTSLMRDRRRMHMRKAQYHWGWDWGPVLLTAGPYMPVYLEAYDARIDNVHVVPALAAGNAVATVNVDVAIVNANETADQMVELELVDAAGTTVTTASKPVTDQTASFSLTITSPQLWWPNGQGEQNLYTANVRLVDSKSSSVDSASSRFGVRTIELVQRPLASEPGTTFMFRVNGRDIFIQGGNWIPADMVLPAISRERYYDWVRLAREGNLNMIRVWGGGIYETDDFMNACDEFGLLVWHDYALACGDYPVHDSFIKSIATEVEVQTKRLRNHPSLALLCGGNEDFMFVDLFQKLDYDHNDMTGPFDDTPFPQRKIYLDTIPRLAEKLCPNVPYWANSPFGGDEANDLTVGDIHQWNVWHGQSLPYQDYKKLGGRFVSEFGMHGFPVDRTLAHFCKGAPPHQWHAQSQLIDCHNKSEGAHTRISRYLAENFRYDMTSLSNFSYASQLMQSEAYVYALQHWKRQFRGPGRESCAGAIIWQLNDVYPCTSWAFVDYFLRPKPSYYAIKRAFAPLAVGVERSVASRWIDENKLDEPKGPPSFQLWAHNTAPERSEVTLELRAYDLATEEWLTLSEADTRRTVALAAGHTTELGELAPPSIWTAATLVVLEATLVDNKTNAVLARYVDWPEPYRYLVWPADTKLTIAVSHEKHGEYEASVTISANRALKGVWLEPVYDGTETDDSREPVWEDNMIDLMPGQSITVGVNGLKGRSVKGRFLADWEVGKENPTKLY